MGYSEAWKEKNKANFAIEGAEAQTEFAGSWMGRQCHQGKVNKTWTRGQPIALKEVIYVPLRNNMYSINQAVKEGSTLSTEGEVYVLTFPDQTKLRFNYKVNTCRGHVMCAIFFPVGICQRDDKDATTKVDINAFHQCLNHRNKADLSKTADKLSIALTGDYQGCIHCTRGKLKKLKISKVCKDGYEKPGERIVIDATSCSTVSLGGNRVVNMKLDFGSGKKWATFLKKKSDIPQDCMDFMELVKQAKGRPPMFIRLDNSAENKEFASICHTKYRTTVFEFTAKDTPQQNGRIEAAIAATWNQV
jgi:hypothetical protein